MFINIYADNSTKIKLWNIGGTAIMTLSRGLLEGKVKSVKDVMKMLFYGVVSGYGFYQSKKLISNGKVFPGVLLANVSASVVENVATGKHPLSRIGYSIGFMRVNLYPFKSKFINFDFSPKDVVSLFISLKITKKIVFKNGLISFEAEKKFEDGIGWCSGIYPTIVLNTKEYVYNHEVVHMVQNLQLMIFSYEPFFSKKKFHLFEIRTQTFNVVYGIYEKISSYKKDIREIESFYFSHGK